MKNNQKGSTLLMVIMVILLIVIVGTYSLSKKNVAESPTQVPGTPAAPVVGTKPTPLIPTRPTSAVPVITSVLPYSGKIGDTVLVKGSGFLSTNTVLFGGGPVNTTSSTNGGTNLTFTVPVSVGPDCKLTQACPKYARLVTPGTYTVAVRNANGTSDNIYYAVKDIAEGTLKGQATATMHCPNPGTGRCQGATDYSQFGIKIYQGNTFVQQTKLNKDGTFILDLKVGAYTVYPDYYTPGAAAGDVWKANLPQEISVRAGDTTLFSFTITYNQY